MRVSLRYADLGELKDDDIGPGTISDGIQHIQPFSMSIDFYDRFSVVSRALATVEIPPIPYIATKLPDRISSAMQVSRPTRTTLSRSTGGLIFTSPILLQITRGRLELIGSAC